MRILYAIQGTGNGHTCRGQEILHVLKKRHDVDILVSGTHVEIGLPYEIAYQFKGLGFIFGKSGGIDLLATYKKNRIRRLLSEINQLPVEDYDLVISDFEPVSAWACQQKRKPCIALSHQAAVLNRNSPKPAKPGGLGRAILKRYAPATARYGFHFQPYDDNIFTPIIRQQVRDQIVRNDGHYTVYLPAYGNDRILKVLRQCQSIKWEVFSKHSKEEIHDGNISIFPVSNEAFLESMATSSGILCGAGFETPAEALYMGKKLLVIPMKDQYEQQCNAAALAEMGVPVLKSLKLKHLPFIHDWILQGEVVQVYYPDHTEEILHKIISENTGENISGRTPKAQAVSSAKRFRTAIIRHIASNYSVGSKH